MKNRRNIKFFIIFLLFITIFCLLLFNCKKEQKKQLILKAADDHALSYPTTQGLIKMGELLKERTNGRITIEVYASAELGAERETIEQTQELHFPGFGKHQNLTALLFVARCCERIGDHITNVAESVHYIVTGDTYPLTPQD